MFHVELREEESIKMVEYTNSEDERQKSLMIKIENQSYDGKDLGTCNKG